MRCNNHKCVKTPLWRGDLIWSWLDLLICRFMFDVKSRSWLILVQVPFCTFDCEKFFTPPPPSPSSHTHFTPFTRTHTIPSYHEQVSYERRNHLRLFRLGLTRVLSFDFVVWMGHLNTIPNCHSGTYSIWGLTISLKIKKFFRVEILEKNPSPWDDSNTFWRRPRAKNPTFILVREKKSALLACLWLSSISKTHVAIVQCKFNTFSGLGECRYSWG